MIYDLMAHQADFLESEHRHTALVGGYGSGKTFAGVLKTVAKKLELPGISVAYYLPTHDLLKRIGFPNFKQILENQNIKYTLHETDKVFKTAYGEIILRSMDDPNYIIGYETGYALIDEADRVPRKKMESAFDNILARNRKKTPKGNSTDFVSTPEGYGFLYNFFVKNPTEHKLLIKGSTYDNPHNDAGYIDALRERYTEAQLMSYLNGEFTNLEQDTVFYNFDRKVNNTDRIYSKNDHLHIGMDFNIGKMSAVIHVADDNIISAVDEIVNVFDTAQMIETLKDRYSGYKITIYPDASGANRKTVGMSDIELLRSEKFSVVTSSKNPLVSDRITTANVAFRDGKGFSRYFVNVLECPNYAEALEQLAYKNGVPDKTSGFDHITDAGSYAIYRMRNIAKKFDGLNL